MSYSIVPTWRAITPELQAELAEFWISNKAILDPERAKLRAQQAVCVLRDADGVLCGVATAFLQIRPRLRQPMYYFRQFIAPAHRGQQQALPMFKAACEILEAADREQPRALGVLMEVENPGLARVFSGVVGARTGAVFLGYSPRGHQLRAVYFKGAKLFQPAPLRRRQPAPGIVKAPEKAPAA
ncbi:hypothetical protein LF41_2170 [Lysobacter dokdonensis DS-58]|uniref:N-acetyltransferase domain-containing protein n=1 Tax=Lysobacter dokdonensis DS-58 TaxID=1300345 RepID=A0A0A2WJL8_9GAMM|nr:hypothetical protein [Lysobacter dokdonensis]KGQ20003.1 hypothetical protein LF41_2170 [Lysobacter dokdonensis DS-58]